MPQSTKADVFADPQAVLPPSDFVRVPDPHNTRVGPDAIVPRHVLITPHYIRYKDLLARNIVNSWATLSNWIENENFPPGIMLGPNTRVWVEAEVLAWLASRPTAAKVTNLTGARRAPTAGRKRKAPQAESPAHGS